MSVARLLTIIAKCTHGKSYKSRCFAAMCEACASGIGRQNALNRYEESAKTKKW